MKSWRQGLVTALLVLGAALPAASAEKANGQSAQSSKIPWTLADNDPYVILVANWARDDVVLIYRVCQSQGPATRVWSEGSHGVPLPLTSGQCIDIATNSTIRVSRTKTDETIQGSYQFISAARLRPF